MAGRLTILSIVQLSSVLVISSVARSMADVVAF
jgi:hypothetical protein